MLKSGYYISFLLNGLASEGHPKCSSENQVANLSISKKHTARKPVEVGSLSHYS